MSSKRATPEATIARFFMVADLPTALTLFRIVRGILEQRDAFAGGGHRGRGAAQRAGRKATSIGLPLAGDASSPKLS